MAKTIYELGLHEATWSGEMRIVRVAGGWIYQNRDASTFVPFSNEFGDRIDPTIEAPPMDKLSHG